MQIITPRLVLREFREDDLLAVREYECNPDTYRYEPGPPSEAATREYLQKAQAWSQEQPRTHFRFAVTISPEDCVRGRISLTLNFPQTREWEIGWAIHPHYWGRGYATEAARNVIDFAFSKLDAHRIVAFCHVLNAASTRVMQKVGMQQDGYLRETLRWNDSWCDELVYSILEREWKPDEAVGPDTKAFTHD